MGGAGKILKVGIRIYEFRAMNLRFYEFLLIFTCTEEFFCFVYLLTKVEFLDKTV